MPLPSQLQCSPRRFRLLLSTIIASLVVALALPALASACTGADAAPRSLSVARSATLCLLNQQRAAHGLSRLRAHRMLQNAAQRYAGAMVRGGFFSHVTPTGSTLEQRIRQGTRYLAGALRYEIGENIAWGQGELGKPSAIVAAWMASPGHRANILRPTFREIGIGIVAGAPVPGLGGPAFTYANEFGTRR